MVKREGYRIDKSVLAIPTRRKVDDDRYLQSYKNRVCGASGDGINECGLPAIGAHCRTGECAGIGTKPSDDLTFPLCDSHHMEQERSPGPEWWLENVLKPMMRRQYREWKNGHTI